MRGETLKPVPKIVLHDRQQVSREFQALERGQGHLQRPDPRRLRQRRIDQTHDRRLAAFGVNDHLGDRVRGNSALLIAIEVQDGPGPQCGQEGTRERLRLRARWGKKQCLHLSFRVPGCQVKFV
jgi:hypothetical protein